MDNSKVQTLQDYVVFGYNTDYGFNKLTMLKNVDGYILPDDLIYDKFRNLIFENSYIVALDDEEYKSYRYRPDALAYKLYNNPNLSHILLYLNNCSELDFDLRRVRVLNPNAVIDLLKVIAVHESEDMSKNKKSVIG